MTQDDSQGAQTSEEGDEITLDMSRDTTYLALTKPFDKTFRDNRGGVEITYITGEQAISRANAVIGVHAWDHRVLLHFLDSTADEVVVLIEVTAEINGRLVTRQQWGSQKVKRSRSTGTPLDLGFDYKGATTDGIKKCLASLGIGLYLSRKGEKLPEERQETRQTQRPANGRQQPKPTESRQTAQEARQTALSCAVDRKRFSPRIASTDYVARSQNAYGCVLCPDHGRAINEGNAELLNDLLTAGIQVPQKTIDACTQKNEAKEVAR